MQSVIWTFAVKVEVMEIAGYIASLIIGISLGLIGGGGSILTVPVLVYLFRVAPAPAMAYSLFIVGTTSLVGTFQKKRSGDVNLRTAILFGIPSIAAVFITRAFIVPALPGNIITVSGFTITKEIMLMTLFAILMVLASISMIRKKKARPEDEIAKPHFNYLLILLEGTAAGLLSGLVGAGGGFLIIPALVLLGKLPMRQAVGTSLLIIAAQSLIGFTGDLGKHFLDWSILFTVTGLAITGFFLGNALSRKISSQNIKKGFGWFVLAMGIYIIIKELLLHAAIGN